MSHTATIGDNNLKMYFSGELDEYFKSMALLFQCDLSFPFYPRVKCPCYMNVVVLISTDHHRTASAKDSYNNLNIASILMELQKLIESNELF